MFFFIVTAMLCLRCSVIYVEYVQLENIEVPRIECIESNMSNTFDIYMLVEVGGDSLTYANFLISEQYFMV